MYNKEKIIEVLSADGDFIDKFLLDAYIKTWKIESIYEDENGVEYFDEEAIEKIKQNLSSKKENNENNFVQTEIITKEENVKEENSLQTEITEQVNYKEEYEQKEELYVDKNEVLNEIETTVKNSIEPELKNVTLDISQQTLSLLADSIAQKITSDVAKFIKNTNFVEEAMNAGSFRKDNEILAKRVQEIVSDNKILTYKIKEMEEEKASYIRIFGNFYIKKSNK